jgi:hypothetical protein
MAHFAKLDSNNIVTGVFTVKNSVIQTNGADDEAKGINFLKKIYGSDTVWKQTSFNGNIRKNYAAIGYSFDEGRDAFIAPKPYPSWILNETTCKWEAPVPSTGDPFEIWDEENLQWVIVHT